MRNVQNIQRNRTEIGNSYVWRNVREILREHQTPNWIVASIAHWWSFSGFMFNTWQKHHNIGGFNLICCSFLRLPMLDAYPLRYCSTTNASVVDHRQCSHMFQVCIKQIKNGRVTTDFIRPLTNQRIPR